MIFNIRTLLFLKLIFLVATSCDSNTKSTKKVIGETPVFEVLRRDNGDTIHTGVSLIVKGVQVPTDSIRKPKKTTLRTPKILATNTNTTYLNLASLVKKNIKGVKREIEKKPLTIKIEGKSIPYFLNPPQASLAPQYKDNTQYTIQFLDVDQGLQSSYIFSLLQDKRGNMWIGSNGSGISKYNGSSFEQFAKNPNLDSNTIFKMIEDSKGSIWFATFDFGFGKYDGQNYINYNEEQGIPSNTIRAIIEDSKENIWVGSNDGLLKLVDNKITRYTKEQGLPDNVIKSIYEDSKGNLWIGTEKGGLSIFNGEYFVNYNKEIGFAHNNIMSVIEDSKGNMWIGTNGNGLVYYNHKTFTTVTAEDGLGSSVVYSLLEDSKGNIWIGTNSNGLLKYDGNKLSRFGADEGLSNATIWDIKEDEDGMIWVASNGNGVFKLNPNAFQHYTKENGLSQNTVLSLCQDQNNTIWMGTGLGINKYSENNIKHYGIEQGLNNVVIQDITQDSKQNMWFGTYGSGVTKLSKGELSYYGKKEGLSGTDVFTVVEDSKQNMWFGTIDGGVTKYDGKTYTHFLESNGFLSNEVWTVFEDSKQNMWFGTNGNGVAKYNGEHFVYYSTKEGLSSNVIMTITESSDGDIWLGTYGGGISRFNGSEFSYYTTKEGLSNNVVWGIQEVERGFWVSTERGLNFIDKESNDIVSFDKQDGLKGLDFYRSSVLLDKDENLWWGSGKSLTRLTSNAFKKDTTAPKLQLDYIQLEQEFVDYRKLKDSIYKGQLSFGKKIPEELGKTVSFYNYPEKLELPFSINHLTFHFSGIDWQTTHKIVYQYKIEGLDEKWSIPSSKGVADYRNIPYGNYTLLIKAKGASKIWSKPFTYGFIINPPWWHTWWARFLYIALLIILIYGFLRWRTGVLRKKQKEELLFQRKIQEEKLEQQRKLTQSYSRFVPSEFLQSLNKKNITDVVLGDHVESNLTVMFSDIRSYTTLSESMTVKENFKFLNAFLGRMGPLIKNNQGFVNQFLGDGIMALFQNEAENALKAALAMLLELQEYNKEREKEEKKIIQVGIGLHYGPLMMGIIGDDKRMDAGVVSDTVNTAARVEGLTKFYGASLVLSKNTVQQITNLSDYKYRYLGKVLVKGKQKALGVYEFFGGDEKEILELKEQTKAIFDKGLDCYYKQDFITAIESFKEVLAINKKDKAAALYVKQSKQYIKKGVPIDWAGTQKMTGK